MICTEWLHYDFWSCMALYSNSESMSQYLKWMYLLRGNLDLNFGSFSPFFVRLLLGTQWETKQLPHGGTGSHDPSKAPHHDQKDAHSGPHAKFPPPPNCTKPQGSSDLWAFRNSLEQWFSSHRSWPLWGGLISNILQIRYLHCDS